MSDTTPGARRDEWITAGVLEKLCVDAVAAFDRIFDLDLIEFAIDGSLHRAPYGGEGTGVNPTGRGQTWLEIGVDRLGIPLGWTIDDTNRNAASWSPPSGPSPPMAGSTRSTPSTSSVATTTPKTRRQLTAAG